MSSPRRFDLATHVLRHWEDVGLLAPARDSGGRRRYGRDDLVRVAVILRSKAAGMTLDQVAVLLDSDARDRHLVLQAHLDDLARRMAGDGALARHDPARARVPRPRRRHLPPLPAGRARTCSPGTGSWPFRLH